MTDQIKPTLSVDFDNTIHAYSKGWHGGEVYDPPTAGARAALERLSSKYRVVVLTARADLAPVREALSNWGLDKYVAEVTNVKGPSVGYIDDKAVPFNGNWDETIVQLERLTGEEVGR